MLEHQPGRWYDPLGHLDPYQQTISSLTEQLGNMYSGQNFLKDHRKLEQLGLCFYSMPFSVHH